MCIYHPSFGYGKRTFVYVTGSEKTTLITQKGKIILLDRTVDEPIFYRLQFVSGA